MDLGVAVLEDVRRDLASTQNVSARPVLNAVDTLKEDELRGLQVLSHCCKYGTFEDLWNLEFLFKGTERWTRDRLHEVYDKLLALKIFRLEDERINFNGDDFDKIYIKYLSRQRKQRVSIYELEPEITFVLTVLAALRKDDIDGRRSIDIIGRGDVEEFEKTVQSVLNQDDDRDELADIQSYAKNIYMAAIEHRADKSLNCHLVQIRHPWGSTLIIPYGDTNDAEAKRQKGFFGLLGARLKELGGEISEATRTVAYASTEKLIANVTATKNERLRSEIGDAHIQRMYDEYVDRQNAQEAYFHGELAIRYGHELDADERNNFGFVALATGHIEQAKEMFRAALKDKNESPLLPAYNLAMAFVKSGELSEAMDQLDWCVRNAKDAPKSLRSAACLFVPFVKDGLLDIVEKREDLDIWKLAKDGKAILEGLQT